MSALVLASSRALFVGSPFALDLTELRPAHKLDATQLEEILMHGVSKKLLVLHKPFGGNELFYYNEDFVPILDLLTLYKAETIIFTNQRRVPGEGLAGRLLFTTDTTTIPISGYPSLNTRLEVHYSGGSYTFQDEYSFWKWGDAEPTHAVAWTR